MRVPAPVYVGLVVASALVCVVFWRELQASRQALAAGQAALQAERQQSEALRTELAQARADLAARPVVQMPAAAPEPASKPAEELVAMVTDAAKRQKAMLENSETHKARLAEVRATLKNRNPLLARELGISEQEADKVFDLMAEGQLRQEALAADLIARGNTADAATVDEMRRQQQAQEQQDKNSLAALLGQAGYEKLQYVEETQAARTRIVNMTNLLAQSGQPMSTDQALSLTRVMADEQKREEKESQELRASGTYGQVSQVDRAVEGDRRILDAASGFLSAQQLQTIRTRFEQRQAMERATGNVQARERAATQDAAN